MATATIAFGGLFNSALSLILRGDAHLTTFSPDQLNSLALLSLKVYGAAGNHFLLFYGIGSMLVGYLMLRSGYLPRVLGVLWILGGLGFVTKNVLWVFAPADASFLLQVPALLAGLLLGLWLLVRGVDVAKRSVHEAVAPCSAA
jgi:hypothetical protein